MAETQPMNLQALCYTAAEDRQALAALVCGEGVADFVAGDLLVTTTGAGNHSVNVAAGQGYVAGDDDAPDQGMYRIRNDAAETVQLPVGSGGGLNRIDTIVARVRDSEYSGLDNDWVLEVVAGTAGAAAGATTTAFTPAVLATAGAVPDNAIVLAYVRVLAADTLTSTIVAGDVSDARKAFTACSGSPVLRMYRASAGNYSATPTYAVLGMDTVSYNGFGPSVGVSGSVYNTSTGKFVAPAPGLYRVGWALGMVSGAATDWLEVIIYSNAVGIAQNVVQAPVSGISVTNSGSVLVPVTAAGQLIHLEQRASAARAVTATTTATWMTFEKVG